MAAERRDPVTGQTTTGHEWNGIEELNSPVPGVVIFFLAAFSLFAVVYWFLMPAWPTGAGYTKGLLGIDQRAVVNRQVVDAAAARAAWTDRIAAAGFSEIASDPTLMRHVRDTGRTLFIDNCAVCHGVKGTGGPGYPNLAAGAWSRGGEPETIARTITVGINSTHRQTRISQMLAFGRDGVLKHDQIRSVTAFVRSLSGQALDARETALLGAGGEVYAAHCASCHGETGRGKRDIGAPDLTDPTWVYGGDAQSVYTSIHSGRMGHMPHWSDRLTPTEIKVLTLYVLTLQGGKP
ncbi:MAG: cytochrome-c oxidase, cbb3-type subunit III [Alphaproteobacteria bacterium]